MKVLLFGGSGLLGSELQAQFRAQQIEMKAPSSREVDCRDRGRVEAVLRQGRPDVVIMAAARGGGILANIRHGSEFLHDNALMNLVTLRASVEAGVPRILVFGASCMYPKEVEGAIRESHLLTGPLEQTSELYALSKILATKYALALGAEGRSRITVAVPTNLYGDRDRFSAEEGHLISSLMVRMHRAKTAGEPKLDLWGDGKPRRDFLHAADAARACRVILQAANPPGIVHIGSGEDRPVRELAEAVAQAVGYTGQLVFNGGVSNGAAKKLLDVEWLFQQGWRPEVLLQEGLRRAYRSYLSQQEMPVPSLEARS